ncbi:MAG: phosphonoacetaldehyde hydrolase [Anaerolineales bacterium]
MDFTYQHSYHGPVQAVILDWAGTTVDYGSFAPTAVFMHLFEIRGARITAEDARSGMGLMKRDHLRTILARPSVAAAWEAEHGAPASEADIESMFRDFVHLQISVLRQYANPIPGLLDVVDEFRSRKIKIGSTTGYIRSMMNILAPEAEKCGYKPDSIVCADDVPAGRPYPWMCYQNAINLQVYPMQAMIKVGDTLPDIEEGLNAGMWTVGLSQTGNLLGLREEEVNALSPQKREEARQEIETQLYQAGAHYVIDGIWDLPLILDEIESRLANGERP